jgi:hypothetical protein
LNLESIHHAGGKCALAGAKVGFAAGEHHDLIGTGTLIQARPNLLRVCVSVAENRTD